MLLRIAQPASIACIALASALILCACEPPAPDPLPSSSASTPEIRKPVLWQRVKDATVIAVDDAEVESQVAAASAEAHRTRDDARQRWSMAKPEERALWAVKWAAPLAPSGSDGATPAGSQQPTANSRIEHIWVQPINWSPFRIEGVLLSEPVHALDCGRSVGEVVSFPIDELSDWLHFASDPATNPDTPFEGGFTVKVLEEKYGSGTANTEPRP